MANSQNRPDDVRHARGSTPSPSRKDDNTLMLKIAKELAITLMHGIVMLACAAGAFVLLYLSVFGKMPKW